MFKDPGFAAANRLATKSSLEWNSKVFNIIFIFAFIFIVFLFFMGIYSSAVHTSWVKDNCKPTDDFVGTEYSVKQRYICDGKSEWIIAG
jgi:hypothetical protein